MQVTQTTHVTFDGKGATLYTDNGFTNPTHWTQSRASLHTPTTIGHLHTHIGHRASMTRSSDLCN